MARVKGQSNSEIAGSPESYLGSASDEYYWGRALLRLGVIPTYQPLQTPNTSKYYPGDTRRVLTSVVERETTQTAS